ncbi:hypothetical protein [Sediminibacillus halophilus]|uniref:Lipoprotein n=1 Tax=Sediminibacillus halophilus TaxID=482461 RepID=A0A1G9VGU0_9BACI|nr:hypothetical protein [Sediminibacillus halophilus]SDM71369.1 hypothetical protein SAMN05216244_3279 [Sediminibacillus halophilus]
MKYKTVRFAVLLALMFLMAACGDSENQAVEKQEKQNSFTTGQEPMTLEKERDNFHLLAKIYSHSSDSLTVEGVLTYTGEKPVTLTQGMEIIQCEMVHPERDEAVDEMIYPDIAYTTTVKPNQSFPGKQTFTLQDGEQYELTIKSVLHTLSGEARGITLDTIEISW